MEGGGNFRANFGVEREGVNLLAEDGSHSKGSDITTGYPEIDAVMLKKLGWWDELTPEEQKAAEGKNWKTDLSGGIIRVAMQNHGVHPFGNAKARAVVWNFPDPIPQHREPLFSNRPDLVAKYPTHDDRKAFWRLPTLFKSVQDKNADISTKFPLIMTSGRLVEYEGGGEETRSNPLPGRAAAGHVRRAQPGRRQRPRHPQRREWCGSARRPGRQIKVKALVTERVDRADRVHAVPLLRPLAGRGSRAVLPGGRDADRARRGDQHRHHLRLRQRDDDAGNEDDAVPGRAR